jgi:dTDP-4-amino-4,6-dideoxygalactose transaminase
LNEENGNLIVPFTDLKCRYSLYRERFHKALDQVLEHGQFILGPEVAEFESVLSNYLVSPYAIAVANGTDALILALKSHHIGDGDEVITTPMSYLASTSAIALSGATPVFADVGKDLNLDPEAAARAISERTRAILVVHLAGNPAKMGSFIELAKKHNLLLIEDCAQAIGATLAGKYVGTFGNVAAMSLHPLKNLGTIGDAGAILTADEDRVDWLHQARNHGHRSRDQCKFWSLNSRMDTLQATFLLSILADFPDYLTQRRAQARCYLEGLREQVEFPQVTDSAEPSYNFFVILAKDRDVLQEYLIKRGIETKIHYPIPIHRLDSSKDKQYRTFDLKGSSLEEAERYTANILSLPLGPHLSDQQIDFTIDQIRAFYCGGHD